MSSIYTLVDDIYELVKRKDGWFTEELSHELADEAARRLREQFSNEKTPTLRLSRLGSQCPKAFWASIHAPEEAEPLPPWAQIKYSYGHILEALVITLAKAAGHSVVGEQDELVVDGVVGHRDCVIDGCVVDVKSSSTMGFDKFKNGTIGESDSFGYLFQLDAYLVGSRNDPLVKVKDKGYLLAIDKQLGHLCLYEHRLREDVVRQRIKDFRAILSSNRPPDCTCEEVPDGASGNIRLGTTASYSAFKHFCKPHLRTFLYANGPRYLTHVVRKPYDAIRKRDIREVDRNGKTVYN